MKTLVILTASLVLAFCSCAPKPDIQAEKAAVRAIIDSLKTASETNNSDILATIFSHSPDNIFFGTDSAERWVGYESIIDAFKRTFASVEPGSQMTLRDVVVGVSSDGDAAWVSYLTDWKGKSQGQPFAFTGLRFTAVLEKQNSKWSIVHVHCSVPVSGQAIKY
ncbi:MAG: nuclear transport factor 2 family protein [Bacteroidota bacterium]